MLLCMRTTIDIPDALFRQLKQEAARQGVSLRDLVLRAVRAQLGKPAAERYRFEWRVDHKPWNADLPVADRPALERYLGGWRNDLYG
jgi:hypothetical protein